MSITPWGESDTLRDRRLRPGPGVPRDEVERNQRERLFGATVAVIGGHGYANSSVGDLIAVAGVSRTTFYGFFSDKEECFLATLDELISVVLAATEQHVHFEGTLLERAQSGLRIFLELLIAQPDAARICVVESYAAGPRAVKRVDWAMDRFRELIAYVFDQLPQQRGMPEEMLRAMVGAMRKMMHTRLNRRTEGELVDVVPELLELALRYQPPPRRLRGGWAVRGTVAGRAERLSGELEPSERIELATMAIVARDGFAEAGIAEIAGEARLSLSTFYEVFDGKEAAFEAALYRRRLQMYAAVVPPYRAARNWPEAIRAIVLASLAFFEGEPDFARLVAIDVYGAGSAANEHRDATIDASERFIEDAPGYADLGSKVAAEAIQSGIYALLSNRVQASGSDDLRSLAPLATYFILVPFLGPEDSWTIASGQSLAAESS
jgi:AcrR family transcriptional regulator